jgi:hypothetical protein
LQLSRAISSLNQAFDVGLGSHATDFLRTTGSGLATYVGNVASGAPIHAADVRAKAFTVSTSDFAGTFIGRSTPSPAWLNSRSLLCSGLKHRPFVVREGEGRCVAWRDPGHRRERASVMARPESLWSKGRADPRSDHIELTGLANESAGSL